jgi:hypothetical protein
MRILLRFPFGYRVAHWFCGTLIYRLVSRKSTEPRGAPGAGSDPNPPASDVVLRRYVTEWASGILRHSQPTDPADPATGVHLVYVVAFAGPVYTGPHGRHGDAAFAPLLSAIHALDACLVQAGRRGRAARVNVVLVENDPVGVDRLVAALVGAGLEARVRQTRDLDALLPGEIAVVHGEFAHVAPELVRFTAVSCRALYLLDPPTPAMLPLQVVRLIADPAGTDALIRFPADGLRKQAQFRNVPLADLPTYARRIVEGYSLLLGDPRYGWVAAWRETERTLGEAAAETRVQEQYRDRLAAVNPQTVVKTIRLSPPADAAATGELFLLTQDPAHPFRMNRALRAARLAGELAWDETSSSFVTEEDTGVLDLFAPGSGLGQGSGAAPSRRVRRVDLPALAQQIVAGYAGQTVEFGRVLAGLADSNLFIDEVKQAMSLLRQEGRAAYQSLAAPAQIRFPPAGTTVRREPRTRRRVMPPAELSIELPGTADSSVSDGPPDASGR